MGWSVLVAAKHTARLVSVRTLIRTGGDYDTPELAGLASLTGELLDEGAGTRDAVRLAEDLGLDYPRLQLPERASVNTAMLVAPLPSEQAAQEELVKGPNITALPGFPELPDRIEAPVLLKVGDDVSTDDISPAGARALPYRSNIDKLAEFTFTRLDEGYPKRARELAAGSGHVILAGHNYCQ